MNAGALVISLDFELHWGVRDKQTVAEYRQHLEGARRSIPKILRLFKRYQIHATWATVGFLFCSSKQELRKHLPHRKPRYVNRRLSPYSDLQAVGDNEHSDPYHYALSLLQQIVSVPGQEIGSHTLSHYYCLEPGQTPEDFAEDLEIAQSLAQKNLGLSLGSLIFPRNQYAPNYLHVANKAGIKAFRGTPSHWSYLPCADIDESPLRRGFRLLDSYVPLHQPSFIDTVRSVPLPTGSHPMVNIPASMFLRPYSSRLSTLERCRYQRIERAMHHAATHQRLIHLWWHPHNFGTHPQENLRGLERILSTFEKLRTQHGIQSLNMYELATQTQLIPQKSPESDPSTGMYAGLHPAA